MTVKLLTEHHLEFLSLTGGCIGSSESTHVKIPNCWKSHVTAHMHQFSLIRVSLDEGFGPWLPSQRTTKILIRLGGCPGGFEASLCAHSLGWFCLLMAHIKFEPRHVISKNVAFCQVYTQTSQCSLKLRNFK